MTKTRTESQNELKEMIDRTFNLIHDIDEFFKDNISSDVSTTGMEIIKEELEYHLWEITD